MQIKRFEAKTMTAALKMVKDEFGVNAVILSARSLRDQGGLFGMGRSTGVEVTAANDSGASASVLGGAAGGDRWVSTGLPPGDARTERRGLFQSLNDGLRSLTQRRVPAAADAAAPGAPAQLTQLYQHLLAQEVERGLAGDLVEQILRLPGFDPQLGPGELQPHALRVLQDMGVRTVSTPADSSRPIVKVLVGPGGAGKTTTAVKLAAANVRRNHSRNGALLTLDDQRIGAIEQLRIFGSILEVPVAVATSAAGVRDAWQAHSSMDWLIVDTPGVSHGDAAHRSELRQILEPLKHKEVHLVLNACTREKDLMRTIEAWRGFPVDRLTFTRLDEAGTYGHLLNLLAQSALPLACLGTGPSVPEDLLDQSLKGLLDRIWPVRSATAAVRAIDLQPQASATSLPDDAVRVANGSSELYHRSDCKWVRKIKPEHLIRFASAAEAEARQFVACRNCHAQRDTQFSRGSRTGQEAATAR